MREVSDVLSSDRFQPVLDAGKWATGFWLVREVDLEEFGDDREGVEAVEDRSDLVSHLSTDSQISDIETWRLWCSCSDRDRYLFVLSGWKDDILVDAVSELWWEAVEW